MEKEEINATQEALKEFLKMKNVDDFFYFCLINEYKIVPSKEEVVAIAKNTLTDEEYNEFIRRNFPLEEESKENEELKRKLCDMAERVAKREANLIDIVKELHMGLKRYGFLIGKIRRNYRMISANTYILNKKYLDNVEVYDIVPDHFSTRYVHLSDIEESKIRNIVREAKLPLNSITYTEAYHYALRKGVIVLKRR